MWRNILVITLGVLLGVVGCNQKVVCPHGYDPAVEGCEGMPPFPGPVGGMLEGGTLDAGSDVGPDGSEGG